MAVLTEQERATYRGVFAVGEFRALWAAQVISFAGDQFARVALALLVYSRTGSAALAAVTFAAGTAAQFAGGLLLGWVADRYPRRAVMIGCDLACAALVAVMAIPGVPLPALIVLLFTVALAVEPFLAARMATNRAALGPGLFPLGNAITISTYQLAQLAGFAAGGVVAATAGTRTALLIDAASFAASALIVRAGVRARPAPGGAGPARPDLLTGARLVFTRPAARTAVLLMWLAAFFAAPEGVTVPLGAQLGGGATVGWLLAAMTAGAAAGALGYTRLLGPARSLRGAALPRRRGVRPAHPVRPLPRPRRRAGHPVRVRALHRLHRHGGRGADERDPRRAPGEGRRRHRRRHGPRAGPRHHRRGGRRAAVPARRRHRRLRAGRNGRGGPAGARLGAGQAGRAVRGVAWG